MPKLVVLASVLPLIWGCAARRAIPAESPASPAGELHDGAAASTSQALPPDATPMPTKAPAADNENELTDPSNSSQKLAQARAMGCVGIR